MQKHSISQLHTITRYTLWKILCQIYNGLRINLLTILQVLSTTNSTGALISHLVINPIMISDTGAYTCSVISVAFSPVIYIYSFQLVVNNSKLALSFSLSHPLPIYPLSTLFLHTPTFDNSFEHIFLYYYFIAFAYVEPIEDIEVSNDQLGQVITINCRVSTCRDNAEVVFAREFETLNRAQLFSDATNVILSTDLVVSDNITGNYRCRVIHGDGIQQTTFRITKQLLPGKVSLQ